MGRSNGNTEPEFMPGSVRVEDLGMTVADVRAMGFKVVLHWSNVPAVSERDAFALSRRQSVIAEQHEVERRRRDAERERRMQESAPVLRGIPAPDPTMSAVEVMLAADAHDRPQSVYEQLLEEQFARGRKG
jgi:hypothetical protein